MKRLFLGLIGLLLVSLGHASEPLRVFIRSGPKTHGPGAHDYPSFLRDWTKLLNERGAVATGADRFPTSEELAKTDVLILHAEEAGNISGEERERFERYLERGGGVVAIHGGTVSRDPNWYKTIIGGSWNHDHTKWLEGPMSLYFTDRENPISKGASNFDLDDEIYYDMDLMPDVKVLAAAYTPKPRDGQGRGQEVDIHDIQPQIWSYETGNRRAFACIPGHLYENFSHLSLQTILLRGIAWAGKMDDAEALLVDKEKVASALRYPVGGPTRPEEAEAAIELHPEFEISLVAAEPLINKAMNLDWDEKGRLWVVESPEYPNGLRKAKTETWKDMGSVKPGDYQRDPLDRISILTDQDGDGRMDKKHVFADKLELATGFVFHENGVIVSAAPDIWFLEDTDGDLVADRRRKLYTGLGTGDTHAVINNLRWGLDGWIYATHGYSAGKVNSLGAPDLPEVGIGSGVLRFKPDGTEIEMYASKGGNTWGLCMTSDGQCFWTQPTSGTVFFHTVLPEYVLAKGKVAGTTSYKGMITGQKTFPLMTWEQAAYKQIDQVGSYTAAAGCAIYEGGAWPERWNGSYFTGEPTINIVSHFFKKPEGVSFTTEKEKGREETEFIRSRDLWFRPIETRVGPDGALYVIDFYNQAVIHNDTRGPKHGPANAAVRPDRDHYFGRIWKIQHKQAKQLVVPVVDKSKEEDLVAALESPNAHTKMTAIRLIRESGKVLEVETGSEALRAYEAFEDVSNAAQRERLIAAFVEADDSWTQSALVAAASTRAIDVVIACLNSPKVAETSVLVSSLLPMAMDKDPSSAAGKLAVAVSSAPTTADALKPIVLDAIGANRDAQPELTVDLRQAFVGLLEDPATSSSALPLVAKWDKDGAMAELIEAQIDRLSATLTDAGKNGRERIAAARALIAVGSEDAIESATSLLSSEEESRALQLVVLSALGEANQLSRLAVRFDQLASGLMDPAFDEIIKRPESSLAILQTVDDGALDAALIGPGNIARLRSHPDKAVSDRANALLDKLMPEARKKEAIIAQLLPELQKPGDFENGRMMFAAACAVCHEFGDLASSNVGPPLTGMGAHGAAELLVHIVDPNREVDPSFWQWNITTKEGETLAGIITSENAASLNLRNQGGDSEVRKKAIASRQNTRRSLMPEGFEGLGAENLRDILSYMTETDASRYRIIDLREAYTADARRGLFQRADATRDSVFPRTFGNVQAEGIPFFLMDPDKSSNGKSLVVLNGGPKSAIARDYPTKVEIATNVEASRFYLVSGIAGWGYPFTNESMPALKVTLTHVSGETESVQLLNKQHFADYNRVVDVPGSKLLRSLTRSGQLRLITVEVKKAGPVIGITLESSGNILAPVIAAITADLSNEPAAVITEESKAVREDAFRLEEEPPESTAATGQRFVEPGTDGTTRVLVVGAGAAHHFPRDFIGTDSETLRQVPRIDVVGTMNLEEALATMPLADVLVFSGNHPQFGTPEFQKALHTFADAGKGMVMLHAATWSHPWKGYNDRFVAGRTPGHGKGEFEVTIRNKAHVVTQEVPETFKIIDENYRFKFAPNADYELLAVNEPDKTDEPIPSVWVVNDPKARIVCITLGHDERAHANPAYKTLLVNAVKWVARR
ncbi:PVC-type heme-binding CxxCH protein [Haloferula sp.]|uniref:PVC-type heme-binding CxxCH protein n=1 Tax=Haloferula sp. TaxID=2497595 RepID=UPI003C73637F